MKTDIVNFVNRQRLSLIILIGTLTGVFAFAQTPAIPEPFVNQSDALRAPYFGSDRTVELLGDILLKSDDVYERAQAAVNLGQTNNMNAVKYLVKGFGDKDQQVRISIVMSAAELVKQTPEYMRPTSEECAQAVKIIQQAFSDPSQNVKLAAISAAGSAKVQTGDIISLVKSNDLILATQALNVINQSGEHLRMPDSDLIKPMESNSLSLQLATINNIINDNTSSLRQIPAKKATAIANIANEKKTPSPLIPLLKKTATSNNNSLAAASIEALTILDAAAAKPFIEKASKSNSPLLRRAAVNSFAMYREWKTQQPTTNPADKKTAPLESINLFDKIPAFLDDESPLVKLAAVQAAEVARKNNALVNQTQQLVDIAFAAPDTQLHEAAVAAALAADGENLIKIAADAYKKMMPEYLSNAETKTTDLILERNLSSACKILCGLKSDAVYKQMLGDIEKLPLNSVIVGEIADVLGSIGNKSATSTLEKMLQTCQAAGAKYLIAMATMSTPPAFSENVTVKILNALVTLNARGAAKTIINIAQLNVMNMRLATVAAAVPPAIVKLYDADKSAADKLLVAMITDNSYGSLAIFNAIIAAGKLHIKDALPNLEKVLTEERPSKITIWAAAWAIGQISGKYPAQPQPVDNQGNWIIRSIK